MKTNLSAGLPSETNFPRDRATWTPAGEEAVLRRRLVRLVVISFLFCLAVLAFKDGVAGISYGVRDSAGRVTGFNERFSGEHNLMALKNMSLFGGLSRFGPYEGVLAVCNAVVIYLLLRQPREKWIIRFCLIQPLLFPFGLLGLLPLFLWPLDFIFWHRSTSEDYIDIPFVMLLSQAFWWITALVTAWRLHRFRKRRNARESAGKNDEVLPFAPSNSPPAMIARSVFHSPFRTRRIKWTIGALLVISLVLVALGFYLRDIGFFLRWFFGFQADD